VQITADRCSATQPSRNRSSVYFARGTPSARPAASAIPPRIGHEHEADCDMPPHRNAATARMKARRSPRDTYSFRSAPRYRCSLYHVSISTAWTSRSGFTPRRHSVSTARPSQRSSSFGKPHSPLGGPRAGSPSRRIRDRSRERRAPRTLPG